MSSIDRRVVTYPVINRKRTSITILIAENWICISLDPIALLVPPIPIAELWLVLVIGNKPKKEQYTRYCALEMILRRLEHVSSRIPFQESHVGFGER